MNGKRCSKKAKIFLKIMLRQLLIKRKRSEGFVKSTYVISNGGILQ